jgi:hypothetical protein
LLRFLATAFGWLATATRSWRRLATTVRIERPVRRPTCVGTAVGDDSASSGVVRPGWYGSETRDAEIRDSKRLAARHGIDSPP